MISKENKAKALKRIREIEKNPPVITEAHRRHAAKLLEQNKKFYEDKDRGIDNERKAISKDLAGWVHNQYNGVGKVFHGYGEGKMRKIKCWFCGQHCSSEFFSLNGKWYGKEHKQFSNLNEEEQERERKSCLLTKLKTQ